MSKVFEHSMGSGHYPLTANAKQRHERLWRRVLLPGAAAFLSLIFLAPSAAYAADPSFTISHPVTITVRDSSGLGLPGTGDSLLPIAIGLAVLLIGLALMGRFLYGRKKARSQMERRAQAGAQGQSQGQEQTQTKTRQQAQAQAQLKAYQLVLLPLLVATLTFGGLLVGNAPVAHAAPGGGTHITLDKAEGTTARFDVAVDARATESRYLDIVAALEDSFPGVSFSLDGDSFDHAGDTAVKQVSDPLNQSGGIHTLTLTAQVSKDLKVGSYTHNVEFTIIDKRMPLTFTGALSVTKAYDGTADINPASIQIANPTSFDGLAGSEGFTLSAVGITSAAFTDATAGANKSVTYTGAFSLIDPQGGALASNYILIAPTLTGTIEAPPAPDTIELEATITAPGQWVTLNKYFDNAFTVDWGDGSTAENVTGNTPHTYAAVGTYTITLTSALTGNPYAVWTFTDVFAVLVPAFDTTADSVRVSYMPPMTVFMSDASTAPANFFAHFNDQGALTSLPAGSFDTSNITAAGDNFFYSFTRDNPLTSLPAGSFNTSNITTVGKSFFAFFNYGGALTALPAGSFDTGGITAAGDDFFAYFNDSLSGPGALASLPDGSFDTGNITTVGNGFFTYFNNFGHLTSLPDGSFDTGNITTVGNDFFAYFNNNGALVSLPDGSFNTSAITAAGNACFKAFNVFGALDSLPDGSFDTSAITAAGDNFFSIFNSQGALTSLPASFKWPPLDLTAASQPGNFQRAFYSSATLNRSAQDIINGCATPDTDRSTFSSNQPGHSALDPNWQG